ncbi:MAG: alpha/beta hydrolase [Aquificae bacterium]|nr:alpha/beta hydrolase [Aquificota bacterium]
MYYYDLNNPKRLWLHLHGLATNVQGRKIAFLREYFRQKALYSFFAMDMDYEKHTTTQTLELLEVLIRGFSEKFGEIVLCGSSHGAYVLLNYLKRKPLGRVKRAVLLAPSYNTLSLMIRAFGEEKLRNWLEGKEEITVREDDREVTFIKEWATDILKNDYEIIKDGRVDFPKEPPVPIYIMHGKRDDIVPLELSELFTRSVRVEKFLVVDDDHQLNESLEKYIEEIV